MNRKEKNIRKMAGIGVLIAGLLYAGISLFFSSHFFFRTRINGFSCQFKTVEQVKEMIRQDCSDFELVIQEREDQEERITSDQLALQFVDDGKLEAIKKQQKAYQWGVSIFKRSEYKDAVTITYDEATLEKIADQLNCLDESKMKDPIQAYPEYKEETGEFEIVKEELGTKIERETFLTKLKEILASDERTWNLDKTGCYVEPKFYSDDATVTAARDQMNLYLKTEITYDLGYKKLTVDKEEVSKWITADEEANVGIDKEKVGDYVQWLGTNYNTCGIRRSFTTPEGKKISVSGGTYGWRIDHKKEVEELTENVKTGEKIEREPVYKQTGQKRDAKGNDLHNTYIAISIETQTMWYYKEGECILTTPVVTGNVNKNMGTPKGVYAIAYKQRDHVLRGDNYATAVTFWMPFYEYRGIGIHDATWRKTAEFGGETYKTNGSHGCVNTPYDAVKTLFEIVPAGTPVVVY